MLVLAVSFEHSSAYNSMLDLICGSDNYCDIDKYKNYFCLYLAFALNSHRFVFEHKQIAYNHFMPFR